jgi:hypothetical protein
VGVEGDGLYAATGTAGCDCVAEFMEGDYEHLSQTNQRKGSSVSDGGGDNEGVSHLKGP